MEPPIRLVVGLGNPPSSYRRTRHNVGREFVDYLAEASDQPFETHRQAEFARLPLLSGLELPEPLILAKLGCFMNESGPALMRVLKSKNIAFNEVLVVADDFMIPFGSLRLRPQGSSGGHNGLKSIIEAGQTDRFARLRVGIGPVPPGEAPADFVLNQFPLEKYRQLPYIYDAMIGCLRVLISEGYDKAMSVTNKTHLE
jgi:PTH1 family peptidyl-tRNA hydrolase